MLGYYTDDMVAPDPSNPDYFEADGFAFYFSELETLIREHNMDFKNPANNQQPFSKVVIARIIARSQGRLRERAPELPSTSVISPETWRMISAHLGMLDQGEFVALVAVTDFICYMSTLSEGERKALNALQLRDDYNDMITFKYIFEHVKNENYCRVSAARIFRAAVSAAFPVPVRAAPAPAVSAVPVRAAPAAPAARVPAPAVSVRAVSVRAVSAVPAADSRNSLSPWVVIGGGIVIGAAVTVACVFCPPLVVPVMLLALKVGLSMGVVSAAFLSGSLAACAVWTVGIATRCCLSSRKSGSARMYGALV